MRKRLFLLAAVVVAACSSDKTTAPETTTATSSSGLTITVDTVTTSAAATVATAVPVRVLVLQDGVAVPNVTVTWSVIQGRGSVAAPSSTTDASGAATVSWTVGDTAGTNTLTAAITGASVLATVNSVGGPITALVKASPDSQTVVAGSLLSLTARALDRFGNSVPNVTVSWTSSGGSLSVISATSGASGNVTTNLLTGAAPATYSIAATVAGLPSVTFTVTGS